MAKLEEMTRSLIIYKRITSPTGSLGNRAKRRMENTGEEAYDLLKKRKNKITNIGKMKIALKWSDETIPWIRAISLALEEFKQTNSEAYKQLKEIREKHKTSRRAYLEFGGEVPEKFYIEAICDVIKGTTIQEAKQIYDSILIMEKRLEKKKSIDYMILPE